MNAVALVVAKAPVPGRVKTRLGRVVGDERAADLAAAALLDTMAACVAAYGVERCHLSLEGDLRAGRRPEELTTAAARWTVHAQHGRTFADRLVRAHHDAASAGLPVVQVGMDTPQLRAEHLHQSASRITGADDAVLGPAYDGGWWLLGVSGPHLVRHLAEVPMSTDRTCADTRSALERAGARVSEVEPLHDVDEAEDAAHVAASAPHTLFARAWR